MTVTGLVQIDENSSLVHSNESEHLSLPGLRKSPVAAWSTISGEATPEVWPRRPSLGDCTPEAWPMTPTPRYMPRVSQEFLPQTPTPKRQASFALGDRTPECWPEHASSFFPVTQQQGFAPVLPLVPVWSEQTAYSANIMMNTASVYRGDSHTVPASSSTTSTSANLAAANVGATAIAHEPSAVKSLPKSTSTASNGKKQTQTTKPHSGADDACPVAIYVDLSGLKEMRPRLGRGERSML